MGVFLKVIFGNFSLAIDPFSCSSLKPKIIPSSPIWPFLYTNFLFSYFSAKGTLSEDTIRLFLRQLGKLFQKIENSCCMSLLLWHEIIDKGKAAVLQFVFAK